MGEECLRDELRTLFLFEKLTDEQLDMLCEDGSIETFPAGPLCVEGEPATCFYVMLDGELIMSKRSGGVDIQTGPDLATRRLLRRVVGVRARRGTHLRGVGAADQAVALLRARRRRVRAVHAVRVPDGRAPAGGAQGRRPAAEPDHRPAREAAGAGHHHRRADPSAEQPGGGDRPRGCRPARGCRPHAAQAGDGGRRPSSPPRRCASWSASRTRSPSRWPSPRTLELTALEASDREDQIGDWLEDHGIVGAWDYAPTFVEAGLDTDWLERVSASVDDVDATASLQSAIGWLKYTIDNELRMNEIAEASKRISALLAGAKQYSQMDRGAYQSANVHELLRSTIMMFGDKIGHRARAGRSRWSRTWTSRCPNCSATQAISTRCGRTSSTTRSRRWTATAP